MTQNSSHNQISTIDAVEAHFVWSMEERRLHVIRYGDDRVDQLDREMRNLCDTGAPERRWVKLTDAQRLQEIMEMAIEFMVAGYDPKAVVAEFAKIREFAALGGKGYTMARALTEALEGRANEDPVRFAERYLS